MCWGEDVEVLAQEFLANVIPCISVSCFDHFLIKFFFGRITDMQKKNFKKKRRENVSLTADKQLNAFLRAF